MQSAEQVERRRTGVKEYTIHYCLGICAIAALLLLLAYLCLAPRDQLSYSHRLRWTEENLRFARHCISVFKEETGRFPESIKELNEYGERFPERTSWSFRFREAISRVWKTEDAFRGHAELDGSGGFFYDPKSGDIKVNLTKPLRFYWRGYTGARSDEIPADW
jgi:hypothetical protein